MSKWTVCTLASLGFTLVLPVPSPADTPGSDGESSIRTAYRQAADRIVKAVLARNEAMNKLEFLCLNIGHRLSGSPQYDQAVDWAIQTMKADGATNVHREKVVVPHWVRGQESATMIKPRRVELHMLGLGGSVGTPPEGITAEVVVVEDEEALNELGDAVKGKIVLFVKAMPPYDPVRGSGYGTAVKYRVHGARFAAKQGAVGCLVRSATAYSLRSPHTGAMRYGEAEIKIPTAAVSLEDAEMIARLVGHGVPVTVTLKMEAETLPDVTSASVIGELRGSTHPDEVVVIGGHFDSWDVGQGAHDDGGGCIIAMEAINVLRKLGMTPRRTIRVVLWANEENGLRGGRAYAKDHADELDKHVAAIESDSGVFHPTGYSVQCESKELEGVAVEQMEEIMSLLSPLLGEMTVTTGHSGADVSPMREAGVILMGHQVEGSKYFHYHHTHADTIDKVDPEELSKNVAALATVAYILADMPQRFGHR